MDMEKKLAEYRARKDREEKLKQVKGKVKSIFAKLTPANKKHDDDYTETELYKPLVLTKEDLLNPREERHLEESTIDVDDDDDTSLNCFSYTQLFYYALCFIFWATVYAIFIQLQFGTVFLIISALILMYINTRTGPKRTNEVSAYSVFNKDCKSIDGTLKAEQFEREIIYGSAGMIR